MNYYLIATIRPYEDTFVLCVTVYAFAITKMRLPQLFKAPLILVCLLPGACIQSDFANKPIASDKLGLLDSTNYFLQLQNELTDSYDTTFTSGFKVNYKLDSYYQIHINWRDGHFSGSVKDETYPGWSPSEVEHEWSGFIGLSHSCGSPCWTQTLLPKNQTNSKKSYDYPILCHPEKDILFYREYLSENYFFAENINSGKKIKIELKNDPGFSFFLDGLDTCYFEKDDLVITYKTEFDFSDDATTETQRFSMVPLYPKWERSDDYSLQGIPEIKPDDDFTDSLIHVKLVKKNSRLPLTQFEMLFSYYCENISIDVLEHPGLNNVKEVVRIKFDFLTCCSDLYNYYFLISASGDVTLLSVIHNVWCDDPSTYKAYVFPNERFGIKNKISLMEITPKVNDSAEVKRARFIKYLKSSF